MIKLEVHFYYQGKETFSNFKNILISEIKSKWDHTKKNMLTKNPTLVSP